MPAGLRSSGLGREERQDRRHADSLRVTATTVENYEGRLGPIPAALLYVRA